MKRLFILLSVVLVLVSCQTWRESARRARTSHPNFIADMDPVSIGSAAAQFDKMFSSSLEKKDMDLYFDPRTDTVYLQFKHQTVTYRQFWEKSNRLQFITALEKYKKDYQAKNLNLRGSRAQRAYGVLKGSTEWGQVGRFEAFMNSKSLPRYRLGYQFKQNSPYFTVSQQPAENFLSMEENKNSSMEITLYFTRAQADELVKLFDQQYLLSFLGPRSSPTDTAPAQDEGYTEK